MGVIINDERFVTIIKTKTINLDLPKDVSNNLKHETDFIIKTMSFKLSIQ